MRAAWIAVGVLAVGLGGCGGASRNDAETAFTPAPGCPSLAQIAPDAAGVEATVRYLADDALGGRLAGSEGERCAAAYIAWRMEQIGLEPAGADGWFADVPVASAVNPHAPGGTGRNVIGVLHGADGSAPGATGAYLVIGAHYDHLGMGGAGSLEPGVQAVHNGADDNASGVAALLAAAELLAAAPARLPVIFVAFTGEELGLLGSARFVSAPPAPIANAEAMINMDMVGRLRDQPLIVNGVGTAEEWPAIVARAAESGGIPVATSPDGYGPSDQTSFYARDIPVLHLFTNVHSEYHKPSDDWQLIDYDGIARIARMVAEITRDAAAQPTLLTLIRTGAPPTMGGGYGTYLGTVPDFAPVERGVRLSGVSAGSPAEAAGLRPGDVLVGLGETAIADLYDLTDALRAHRPGEVVEVRFLRDGAELTRTVRLEARPARSD